MNHKKRIDVLNYLQNQSISFNFRKKLFLSLSKSMQGEIFLSLTKEFQKVLLTHLSYSEILNFLNFLDPDEITDALQLLSKRRQSVLSKKLKKGLKDKVEFLLKFDPKSAAGLMNLDYIKVDINSTFSNVSKLIKRHESYSGKIPSILVVDENSLIGEIPGYYLLNHKESTKVKQYIVSLPTIKYDAGDTETLEVFKQHRHEKICVLDENDAILGLIYSDDVLRVINDAPGESLYDFAGISDEENVYNSIFHKVKNRYAWLLLNLFTAFLAALVVGLFQNTISSYVLLAVYMPIVAGMGGNAGTQTLAVVVRGIALNQIDLSTGKGFIIKELTAGLINGAIIGLVVAAISVIFNQDAILGAIVGVSMIINLMIAGFFGAIIPLVLKKMGKDPATSAAIFITTATDLFGFFVFLGLASLAL